MNEEVKDLSENAQEPESEGNSQIDEAVEAEARSQGWVPKEDYKGSSEDWRDAPTFVKIGKEVNAVLRKRNENYQRRIGELEAQLGSQQETFKEFQAWREKQIKDEYSKKLTALKEEKKVALENNEYDKVVELDDEIQNIKQQQEKPQRTVSTKNNYDPAFQEWADENQWFGQDDHMTLRANEIGEGLRKMPKYKDLVGREFLSKVVEIVKHEFPHKFKTSQESRGSLVEGNTMPSGAKSRKHSWNDIPLEDRKLGQKFIDQKLMTKDEYVVEYFANEV